MIELECQTVSRHHPFVGNEDRGFQKALQVYNLSTFCLLCHDLEGIKYVV